MADKEIDPLDVEKTLRDSRSGPGGTGFHGVGIQDVSLGDMPTMKLDQSGIGRVDRYELLEKLGEGGFGAVYGAKDTEANILVALKALPSEVSCDADEMASIRDNFSLVSKLHHPHIASVLHLHKVESPDSRAAQAMGIKRGDYLVVMEYAPGATLFNWRRAAPGGKLPLFQTLEIAAKIAEALDYAHSQRVLHRDIKPKNVMVAFRDAGCVIQDAGGAQKACSDRGSRIPDPVSAQATIKVLDFGLAAEIRSSMSRKSKELKQSTSGTPNYMAPEQWKGTVQNAATDQYALAVLVYELLSGTVPFKPAFDTGNFQIMLNAVVNNPVEPIHGLTKQQNAVLLRALAKEPQERFASCTDFINALAGGKIHSPRRNAGNAKEGWPQKTQKGTKKVVAAIAAVAIAAAAYWSYTSYQSHQTAKAEAGRIAQLAAAKQQQLAGLLSEAETLFARSDFDGAGRKANEALALDAANSSARDLLTKIQSKVGEQQASTAKVDAKLARERVSSVPDCKVKQEMERQWQIGETAWGRERWQDAWKAYQETIRLAGLAQQIPAYFAVQKKWNDVISNPASRIPDRDLQQYAAAEWTQAVTLAKEAEDLEENPSLGKEKYQAALAKYAEAVKKTEPHLIPRLSVECNVAGADISLVGAGGDRAPRSATSATELEKNQTYTLSVSKKGYKTFSETITADWTGLKEKRVELEEWNGPETGSHWTSPSTGMEFVWIDALKMWVGKYEVTNGEYRKKEPGHDSKGYGGHSLNGARQPVVYVNFDDAQAYAKWLTERDRAAGHIPDGFAYRLPTKDEFTTFVQCGDGREYPWGNNWPPRSNYADRTAKASFSSWSVIDGYDDGGNVACNVEQSWANSWGLYGVGGNVWECTTERAGGSFDAWRGASWGNDVQDVLRCSYRLVNDASYRYIDYGFRLVLSRPGQN